MVHINLSDKPFAQQSAQGFLLICDDTFSCNKELKDLTILYPALESIIKQRAFSGKAGSSLVISGTRTNKPVYLMLVGLGSIQRPAHDRLEQIRRAMGQGVRLAEQLKTTKLALKVPSATWAETTEYELAKALASALTMATYHFDEFITDESRKFPTEYTVTWCAPVKAHDQLRTGIEDGLRLGHGVNQARHWSDLPAAILTPTNMAAHAERIAKEHDLTITVFDEKAITKMGMGGLAAVSKGSAQDCKLVIMEYHCGKKKAPTIALVGKGVTFDSGGLSIKPAARMDEMKDDMAGAAAVVASMELIAHFKPELNIIGIAPLTENLPSGTAVKPGDIIRFYNGKTAEVKNTDAEGRLILADALAYAVKHYAPDAIIDLATLTGACAFALGPFFCGLMSQHEELARRILDAAGTSGDRAWALPFHDDYKVAIRSTVADICNIGNESYRAGAITAGFFLQNFVGSTPWAHLDIAGTTFNVPDISYYRPGATGFGVRLIMELVMNWNRSSK